MVWGGAIADDHGRMKKFAVWSRFVNYELVQNELVWYEFARIDGPGKWQRADRGDVYV